MSFIFEEILVDKDEYASNKTIQIPTIAEIKNGMASENDNINAEPINYVGKELHKKCTNW